MGLFDRRKDEDKKQENISEYTGMRIEVMDEDEDLLFVARSKVLWDGSMELTPITTPHIDEDTDYLYVTLRGYEESVRKAVHMEGDMVKRNDKEWRVSNVHVTGKDNDRNFFRQDTGSADGTVTPMKQTGISSNPCKIINISAGGACIQTDREFMVGDKLLLRANPLKDLELPTLICVVRRVTRRKGAYEYGCEFDNLRPSVEDAIAKSIMEMQRKRMRRE